MKKFRSFDEFWVLYLQEHASPVTRAFHRLGTYLATFLVILAATTNNPWLVVTGICTGYLFAWFAHAVFERNVPVSFRHPILSFVCDLRLAYSPKGLLPRRLV